MVVGDHEVGCQDLICIVISAVAHLAADEEDGAGADGNADSVADAADCGGCGISDRAHLFSVDHLGTAKEQRTSCFIKKSCLRLAASVCHPHFCFRIG